jgi:thiol-disulfide isomerase/thioredoxin
MLPLCGVPPLALAIALAAAAEAPPAPTPPTDPSAPVEGAPAPEPDPKATAPYPMPEFSITDLGGNTLDSQKLRGKVVLIDIWATWCGPCVAAGPLLDQAYRDLKGKGLEMIGIAVPPKSSPDEVQAAARRIGITYPVAVWNQHLAERIQGLRAVPTYILIAPDWTIHKLWVGATPPGQIRREIERLLAAPAPTAAAAAAQ